MAHRQAKSQQQRLPNLKICVDNTESTDESDVDVKEESDSSNSGEYNAPSKRRLAGGLRNDDADDNRNVLSISVTQPTERRFLPRHAVANARATHRHPSHSAIRVYENVSGHFVTGIDMTSEEAVERRESRAKRFGTLSNPKQPITDVDLKNLYKSLGMNMETLEEDPRGWRLEAILLRGTESMSTKDVFSYFSDFGPKSIEWIDDMSCNVLWQDKLTPARAFLRLSSSFEEVQLAEKIVEEQMGDGDEPKSQDQGKSGKNSSDAIKTETGNSGSGTGSAIEKQQSEQKEVSATSQLPQDPVLNITEEETMELDFDDTLDLTAEDPIDQALASWTNASATKKTPQKDASKQPPKEPSKKKDFRAVEARQSLKSQNENSMEVEAGEEKGKEVKSKKKKEKKDKKKAKSKDNDKGLKLEKEIKKEKMDSDGSDSDSSNSSSSSSSSSSGSGSSSSSDSDSGSSSSSSSSPSSSSSGNSSDGSRKKRKSQSERDKARAVTMSRKAQKKPSAPAVPPPAREKSDIQWPPGFWRLGVPCAKADYLFLRYPMKADKKLPGAEKRSKYYVQHGNPNYGGVKGFLSGSRKRKLRNAKQEKLAQLEKMDYAELLSREQAERKAASQQPVAVQSRLAGRLGNRGGLGEEEEEEGELVEEAEELRPRLGKGKDLRAVLNRDLGDEPTEAKGSEKRTESDDEMDYSAELERLMGERGPPTKKRFMRMHADDEEERIKTKKLQQNMEKKQRAPVVHPNYDVEEPEDDLFDVQEPASLPPRSERQYVDYDNVEDDDPFNLFGTSRKASIKGFEDLDDEGDYTSYPMKTFEDLDDDYSERRYRRDEWTQGGRSRDVGRYGREDRSSRMGGGGGSGGGVDLRAKLQGRRRNKSQW